MRKAKQWRLVTALLLMILVAAPIHAAPLVHPPLKAEAVKIEPSVAKVNFVIASVDSGQPNFGQLALFDNVPGSQPILTENFEIASGGQALVDYDATECPSLSCYVLIASDAPLNIERTMTLKVGEEPKDFPTVYLDNNNFTSISGDFVFGGTLVASSKETSHAPADIEQGGVYSITVRVGSTVSWVRDNGVHSVTADGGTFDTGAPSDEWVAFSQTFNQAGQFPYHCKVHGAAGGLGMAGIINVIGADDPTPVFDTFLLLPFMHKAE